MELVSIPQKVRTVGRWYSKKGIFRTVGSIAKWCGNRISYSYENIYETWDEDRETDFSKGTRLNAARHGFSAYSYRWLGLDEKDSSHYLTSRTPFKRDNGKYHNLVDDKYVFQIYTEPYIERIPGVYGVIDGGRYTPHSRDDPADSLLETLEQTRKVVLKPTLGGKGDGVLVVETITDGYLLNGVRKTATEISALEARLDEYLVTEFVQQHDYAEAIFPDTLNTLRIFSIIDPDTGTPSVFRAAHRFGSARSAPADNLSKGGFAANVDVETGEIGGVVVLDADRRRAKRPRHPETEVRVRGVNVPHWDGTCELVREMATHHSHVPFVGWDVAISDDGPVVIEGNTVPGLRPLQIENGFFEDERARKLFRES